MKQSFYVVMGGLNIHDEKLLPDRREVDPNRPWKWCYKRRTDAKLTPNGLKFLAETIPGAIPTMLPRMSEADIDDKSKADYFIKLWLIIQASWFCIQCLFRLIAGYSISLLELNTLGHCLCALLIYWWWREKPFDIFESSPFNMEQHPDLLALLGMNSRFSNDGVRSELECLRYRELAKSKESNVGAEMDSWEVGFSKSLYGFSIEQRNHSCRFHLKKAPYSQGYRLHRDDIRRWELASKGIERLGLWESHSRGWNAPETPQNKRDFLATRFTFMDRASNFENCLVDGVG